MDQIFTRLNKDTMKRISVDTANNYYDRIAQSMPISKYKEAMQNIDNRAAQRNLNANIMATDFAAAGNAEAESLRQAVLSDVRLNNIR
jgi:UDP-galactopyranose mutase